MATSGSTNWTLTRDDIIKRALRIIGHLDPNETPESHDVNTSAEALNALLKSWNNTILGHQLFTQKHATLFMALSQHSYDLGPSGDHASASHVESAIQSAVTSGGKQITIRAADAPTAAQNIGIYLNDGVLQWTTVGTASSSGTLSLAVSLSASTSASAPVFIYTDKMERPVDIVFAYLRDSLGQDKKLLTMERGEYFRRYDKDRDGEPQRYYYEPTLTNGKFYIDWEEDDTRETIRLVYRRPFEDFDATTDNADLPQEWLKALIWNLASEIGPEFGIDRKRQEYIDNRAAGALLEIRAMYANSPRRSIPTGI